MYKIIFDINVTVAASAIIGLFVLVPVIILKKKGFKKQPETDNL